MTSLELIRSVQREGDAEERRIRALSDEGAWLEAAADFKGNDGEIFMQMVTALCAETDVSFWREYRRFKKKVITVHYRKFEGASYQAALARGWLWSRWVVKNVGKPV